METVQTQRVFLTDAEKEAVLTSTDPVLKRFRKALELRVADRLTTPGLRAENLGWWYPAAEYLSDAALQHALAPTEPLAAWLRGTMLHLIRLPVGEWVGPWFRDHAEPFTGHLETAHLCWGIAAVLDLAGEVFTESERHEIRNALHDKGVVLCRRWLQKNSHLANWRGILASGALVASAALNREDLLDEFVPEVARMAQAFQPDGSYGESLQYGNYLANALMLAYEALFRTFPDQAYRLDVEAYSRGMAWMAQSMLYQKPMSGWGDEPRARAVNFNDSAALFRPSGDLLLHVAVRSADPVRAGLARGLFQEYYETVSTQGPHDLATFGMRNDWGFLTLPLLTKTVPALRPEQANLPLTTAFSNGNTLVRDAWNGKSVLAIQGGINDGCYAPGHLQGDLNSFMLVYNRERLLADPGHSCYRNLIHGLECSTQTHNTCTFLVEQDALGLQEDLSKIKLIEQRNVLPRRLIRADGSVGPPVERGGRLRAVLREGPVSLVVSEVAAAYGAPIQEFTRHWLQVGEHLTLVIDRIRASEPVRTVWNWLLNNRDGQSTVRTYGPHLTLYRNQTGLKIWSAGQATLGGPVYAYVHDAYHPEPNQLGEGRPGSGLLFRHTDGTKTTVVNRLYALVADELADIDAWTFESGESAWTLGKPGFKVRLSGTFTDGLDLKLAHEGKTYSITGDASGFSVKTNP
ncbi:heparinase II/III domain-containing protein [Larkinella sp. VNQ87]|uniref:heparinase II/III domain-containing protein n=1 Tax=Larkinella sp. VNQ87 TaxID=3400921 RepID=UPI003BFDA0BD